MKNETAGSFHSRKHRTCVSDVNESVDGWWSVTENVSLFGVYSLYIYCNVSLSQSLISDAQNRHKCYTHAWRWWYWMMKTNYYLELRIFCFYYPREYVFFVCSDSPYGRYSHMGYQFNHSLYRVNSDSGCQLSRQRKNDHSFAGTRKLDKENSHREHILPMK